MKKIILFAFWAFVAQVTFAQTGEVQYEYDRAGNRISRKTIYLKSTTKSASVNEELEEEELYEDVETKLKAGKESVVEEETATPMDDFWGDRNITIYPNPTEGSLKLSITGGDPEDKYTYAIYDSSGIIILKGRINNLGEHPFDLHRYDTGVYILVLESNDDKKTYKIIKK